MSSPIHWNSLSLAYPSAQQKARLVPRSDWFQHFFLRNGMLLVLKQLSNDIAMIRKALLND
jgi:hypothetical protein